MAFTRSEFIIDGIKSSDIGINGCQIVRIEETQIETPWIGGKDIIEDRINYRDTPYFYTVVKQPLEFSIKFSLLDDEYTDSVLFELGKIFGKSKYVEFQTTDFLGKVFYIMATSEIKIITYGAYKGWFEFSARNALPYALSPIEVSTFDFSDLTSTQTFEIDAKFNVMHSKYCEFYYFPKLFIDMKSSSTNITLTNISDGGRQFGFTGLTALESLEIDNELKQIVSSTGNSRISNMINNHAWFRLVAGKNVLSVNSPCVLQLQCQYPIYI